MFTEKGTPSEEVRFEEEQNLVESKLLTGNLQKKEELRGTNKNLIYYCELDNGSSGIFKPKSGELSSFWEENMEGRKYKHERAAYLVSKIVDLRLVPPTVIREIDNEIGSFQEWIHGRDLRDWRAEFFSKEEMPPNVADQEITCDIFKYCIADHDNTSANKMIDENGKIYSTDNGNAFLREEVRFSTNENQLGKQIVPSIINAFKNFLDSPSLIRDLETQLSELLDKEDVSSCINRILKIGRIIVDKGTIEQKDYEELTLNPE